MLGTPTVFIDDITGTSAPMVLSAFPAMDSRCQGDDTVLSGRLDRSALYGMLSEIESLGLELLEVRRETPGEGEVRTTTFGSSPGNCQPQPDRWSGPGQLV